jgi:uncharacterized protein YrzB (UPF0473 family)
MADQQIHDEPEYFVVTNEDGTEEKFEIIYEFVNHETGYFYMLLIPADDNAAEDEEEVYPVRYRIEGDEVIYEMVESNEEWEMIEKVLNILKEIEEENDR